MKTSKPTSAKARTTGALGPHGVKRSFHLDQCAEQQIERMATYYRERLGIPLSRSGIIRRSLDVLGDHIAALAKTDDGGEAPDTLSDAEKAEAFAVVQTFQARPAQVSLRIGDR